MDYEGFLSRFRKSGSSIHKPEASLGGRQEVLFRLDFTDEGAEMTVVNAKGEALSVLPDYRLYQGGTFNVLRILDDIKSAELYSMNWGGSDKRFELRHQPALLFALLRCDQLVDGALNHITVSEDQAEIVLCLKGQEDKEGSQVKDNLITPRLMARVGDQPLQTFRLLSDVFALVGTTIHPVASLGSNYLRLAFFEEPFPKTLLEQYLSIFYSYIDNVALQYEDYTLERSQQPINTIPTLIIEKVDADMALYLRLTHSLAGVSADFVHDFDLTWQAQLSMEKQIILRRIVNTDEQEEQEHLRKAIIRHAPDRKAAKEVWQSGGEFIVPQETAGPFLLKALPELVQRYQVLGAERLREYKVKAVQPKMKLSLSSGIDFLEGTATVTLDGEEFSLRKFLQQYAKQRYVTLSDGNRALVDESYVKRLERIFKKAEKGNTDKVRVSFFDLPDIENLLQERLEGKTFEHYRGFYEGFNKLASQKMKYDGVQAKLRNYQKEGVKWLNYLYENNMGGCLADDMGLGKTLQTITMLTKVYKPHHTAGASLIVMPRSLLFNWQDELQKFAPQLTYYIYYGQQRDLAEAMKYQLVLTTYALVRNDIEVFQQQQFHYIVLDESQNIKNLTSQVTQAVMLLNGHHRLALSGTPIENNLTELYSLYRFLNPAMLGTLDEFNKQYAYPIQRDGDKEVTESLRRKIFPFMLRRLKKDVLKELPDRME